MSKKPTKSWQATLRQTTCRVLVAQDQRSLVKHMSSIYSVWNDIVTRCIQKRKLKRANILRKSLARYFIVCHQIRNDLCKRKSNDEVHSDRDGVGDNEDLSYEGLISALMSHYIDLSLLSCDTENTCKKKDINMKLVYFLGKWPEKIVDALVGVTVLNNGNDESILLTIIRRVLDEVVVQPTRKHYLKLAIVIRRWTSSINEVFHKELWDSLWKIPIPKGTESYIRKRLKQRCSKGNGKEIKMFRNTLKNLSRKRQTRLLHKMDKNFKRTMKRIVLLEESKNDSKDSDKLNDVFCGGFFIDSKSAHANTEEDNGAADDQVSQLQNDQESPLQNDLDELLKDAKFTAVEERVDNRPYVEDLPTIIELSSSPSSQTNNGDIHESQEPVQEDANLMNSLEADGIREIYLPDIRATSPTVALTFDDSDDSFLDCESTDKHMPVLVPEVVTNSSNGTESPEVTASNNSLKADCSLNNHPIELLEERAGISKKSPTKNLKNELMSSPTTNIWKQPVVIVERDQQLDELSVISNLEKSSGSNLDENHRPSLSFGKSTPNLYLFESPEDPEVKRQRLSITSPNELQVMTSLSVNSSGTKRASPRRTYVRIKKDKYRTCPEESSAISKPEPSMDDDTNDDDQSSTEVTTPAIQNVPAITRSSLRKRVTVGSTPRAYNFRRSTAKTHILSRKPSGSPADFRFAAETSG